MLLLAACASPPLVAEQAGALAVEALPGWRSDSLGRVHEALARQCALPRAPAPWPALCVAMPGPEALGGWIARHFVAWPLGGKDGATGLLTGYYEPVVQGSRKPDRPGQMPLYARPPDLVAGSDGTRLQRRGTRLQPYPSRHQIETGTWLAGGELVWLDDPVEAFFLQVQGSGRVRLRDGSQMRIGFADHNGHPYFAIGRELVARGVLAAGSVDADAIKAWLRAHPDQADSVMWRNPRYVFFRELAPGDAGPPGALGVPLTPMRSVATDPAHVPPGALLYIDTTRPDDGTPLRRLTVSQDRGAAIVGAVRADLFWGSGEEAGRLAGITRQPARMWLLWPKGAAPPTR